MTPSEPRVFISYSTSEKALADALCTFLEKRDLPCWIAPRDMEVGDAFTQTIIERIDRSYAMVLILSRTSNESHFIHSEVGNAFHRNIPVLEFRIHHVQLHKQLEFYLRTKHYLDATTGRPEDHFERLYEECSARQAAPPQPLPVNVPRRPTARHVVIVFTAGGLILATLLYFSLHQPSGNTSSRTSPTDTISQAGDTQGKKHMADGRLPDSIPLRPVTHTDAPASSSTTKLALDGAVFIDGPSPELSDTKTTISFFGIESNTIDFSLKAGIYNINGKMRVKGNNLKIIQAEPACTGEMSLLDNGATLKGFFYPASSDEGKQMLLTRQQPH